MRTHTTRAALTRACGWGAEPAVEDDESATAPGECVEEEEAEAEVAAAEEARGARLGLSGRGGDSPPPPTSLASTVATSLDELLGPENDSGDIPTVHHFPPLAVLPAAADADGLAHGPAASDF